MTNGDDRLREADARLLALRIAAESPNRAATVEEIKRRVPELRKLSDFDLQASRSRPREKNWETVVGNAVGSHNLPRIKTSLVAQGLAERIVRGIRVTAKGLAHLLDGGFLGSDD